MSTRHTFLVTGTNQGLGMHTVHQIAMVPDVVVFMSARRIEAAEEALAGFAADIHALSKVVPVQLDITDATSIENAHKFIAAYLKENNIRGLDVLINNAGIGSRSMKETYEVNVFGTASLAEAMRPLINSGGAIVNISSIMGSMGTLIGNPEIAILLAYNSSKAALNALTVNWALEEKTKDTGVRVVAICPGSNKTRINRWTGEMSPAEGCKIIVKTALEKEGRTAVFFNKDGDLPW